MMTMQWGGTLKGNAVQSLSCVQLFETPWAAAHQASLSIMGTEHLPGALCSGTGSPALGDPMDCNLSGSSVPGIFQARILEWGANSEAPWEVP